MKKIITPDLQACLAEIDAFHLIEEARLLREISIIKERFLHIKAIGSTA